MIDSEEMVGKATVGKNPVRAIFFLSDLDVGGAQRTIINVVNALPSNRIAPVLIAGRGNGAARDWLHPSYPFIDLGCARIRDTLWPLRRLLARERADVLVTTMVDANIVASIASYISRRRPKLILRETNSHRARKDLDFVRRAAAGWAYAFADAVVALSRGVAAELVQDYRLRPDRVVTIHNPIDVDGWSRRAEAARKESPPWGNFGSGAPLLVCVGRLIEQKGFDLLLRAIAECQGDGRRAHLVIVGDGPLRSRLHLLASELGLADRLLMPGFIADLAPWYAHADLFVLPSRWEGFGHVIGEAMACGLPVVAFDCPYGPSDILSGGQGGVLVAPSDVPALAQVIDRLLAGRDERERLSKEGKCAANRFATETIAHQYADLIERVAK